MLEKSAKVILTDSDIKEYNGGTVSDRVQEAWGFSLDELRHVIEAKNFVIIKPKDVE
jgi:hypothetical protein